MKEIGNRISISRQNKNLTQEELAKRLGVTSQAVSKWERGISLPDVAFAKELCAILDISADYLLDTGKKDDVGDEQKGINDEILYNLRSGLDSLELIFGKELVPLFLNGEYANEVRDMRVRLSKKGIFLPVMRIRDTKRMQDRQFAVLAYGNVLYSENLPDEMDLQYIMKVTETVIREKYAEILSPDIIKLLVDNLKERYPALIEGIIPEKISYVALTKVTKDYLGRGNSIVYLPRVIEYMQYCMLENPNARIQEILQAVVEGISR